MAISARPSPTFPSLLLAPNVYIVDNTARARKHYRWDKRFNNLGKARINPNKLADLVEKGIDPKIAFKLSVDNRRRLTDLTVVNTAIQFGTDPGQAVLDAEE